MKFLCILFLVFWMMKGASAQWIQQNSGTVNTLISVYFVNSQNGVAVGDSGTILKTSNGGSTWTKIISGTNETLYSTSFANDTIGFAVGHTTTQVSTILKTVDGGASWFNSSLGAQWGFESVSFIDTQNGYAAGGGGSMTWDNNGSVFKTTDGGATWNEVFNRGFYCFNTSFSTPDTGFVLTYHVLPPNYDVWYEISKTTNGGISWANHVIGNINETIVRSVFFTDLDRGYASCGNGDILETTDGGITWTKVSTVTNKYLRSVFFTNASTGFAVGDNEILKTRDGGATWGHQEMPLSGNLFSVYFPNADTGYSVGDSGLIIKTTNGGMLSLDEEITSSNYLKLYPNPTDDKITIETSLKGDDYLWILNANGVQKIEKQISEPMTEIDIRDFPKGVYLVQLRNRVGTKTAKLLIN